MSCICGLSNWARTAHARLDFLHRRQPKPLTGGKHFIWVESAIEEEYKDHYHAKPLGVYMIDKPHRALLCFVVPWAYAIVMCSVGL